MRFSKIRVFPFNHLSAKRLKEQLQLAPESRKETSKCCLCLKIPWAGITCRGFGKRRGSRTTEGGRSLFTCQGTAPVCQDCSGRFCEAHAVFSPSPAGSASRQFICWRYPFNVYCIRFLVTAPQFARVTVSVDIHPKRHFDIRYIFQKADSNFIPVLFSSARYMCSESTYDMNSIVFLVALCAVKLKKKQTVADF